MNTRAYGHPPYSVVVVHGGPGAPGEMAPVARVLSQVCGVLEPLQTAKTVNDQIEELRGQILASCSRPVIMIGYSWGAWLSYLLAVKNPEVVAKLVLVSSGPFDAKYVDQISERRRSRLNSTEREELESLLKDFSALDDGSLERLAVLTNKTDLYDPVEHQSEILNCDSESFNGVWPEAAALRASGELLSLAKGISCPVIAMGITIHIPQKALSCRWVLIFPIFVLLNLSVAVTRRGSRRLQEIGSSRYSRPKFLLIRQSVNDQTQERMQSGLRLEHWRKGQMRNVHPSHVAILVPSVEKSAHFLREPIS